MSWLNEWTKPAGLVILASLTIWLGQLNWAALQATAKNAEQDQVLLKVSNNARDSALLLSIIMEEHKELKEKVDKHQTEAEMWKERIRNNSNDIDSYGE